MFDVDKIKIIFFDVDETLYYKKDKCVHQSAKEAIIKLIEKGYKIVISTGHSKSSLPINFSLFLEELNINSIITIHGQHVIYEGKLINHNPIPSNVVEELIQISNEHNLPISQVADSEVSVTFDAKEVKEALLPVYVINNDTYKKEPVYEIFSFFKEDQDNIFKETINKHNLKIVRWHKYSVEIIQENASKKRGIEELLKYLNLKPENAVAFGDELNDIEAIKYVGIGIAMGNANDKLKEVADYITTNIEDNGVYNALRYLKLI